MAGPGLSNYLQVWAEKAPKLCRETSESHGKSAHLLVNNGFQGHVGGWVDQRKEPQIGGQQTWAEPRGEVSGPPGFSFPKQPAK